LQAARVIEDTRDDGMGGRLDALDDEFKTVRSHQIMNCIEACPKQLNPTAAIGSIKRHLLSRKS